jgi:putrescine carbamoyltransferase
VTDEVLDAPYSIAFDQAGNRLTAMRGILVHFTPPVALDQAAAEAAKARIEQLM